MQANLICTSHIQITAAIVKKKHTYAQTFSQGHKHQLLVHICFEALPNTYIKMRHRLCAFNKTYTSAAPTNTPVRTYEHTPCYSNALK